MEDEEAEKELPEGALEEALEEEPDDDELEIPVEVEEEGKEWA